MHKFLISSLLAISLIGCGDSTSSGMKSHSSGMGAGHDKSEQTAIAYYGDKENNRIVVVDTAKMALTDEIFTYHQKSYAAEVIKTKENHHDKTPKMYVDNRGSNSIDVIDSQTNKITKSIPLDFYPRSINVNKNSALVVVSSVNKPMVSVIDSKTDSVIATVGENNTTYPTTSGHSYLASGTLACGHPEWLDDSHFVLLDRQHKTIKTYKIAKDTNQEWQTTLVNTIQTPSPVHNLIPPEVHGQHGQHGHGTSTNYSTIFYATAEGSTGVYPSVLKLEFSPQSGLKIVENLEIKKEGLSPDVMGVHHLNFLRNQKYIYVGSDEGNLFIVDYASEEMRIEKIVPAGKGAGHTDELKHGNIAVVINHKDSFITLMNTTTNTKIADIQVSNISQDLIGKVQTQSHPQYHFSKDGKYFYLFLTEEGELVKVNLQEKRVVARLSIGGKLSMGSFVER